ncbi:hypothetical protein [Jannaschia sp. 2305UL9-9]|uniref:hypothetical protein n=1 Tax=Jannaschia sp. 2305UL9-9 TaxID=3121638 RepID=UPI003529553D
MIVGLILPLILLAIAGWIVPAGLGRLLPRSLVSLVANALISAGVLLLLAIVLFVWLYGPAAGRVWGEAPAYFLLLGVRSGLIWAPVMVLSVANLPRGWAAADWAADDRMRPRKRKRGTR